MSRVRITVLCLCAVMCLVFSWESFLSAAPPADAKGDVAKKAKPARLPVVAIIPPIGRGDSSYAAYSPALTTMLGSIFEQSGKVIVVDRTSMGKVFSEKDLARLDLSDREKLAQTGQLIDANYVLTGYYDVRSGNIQLQINLVNVEDWLKRWNNKRGQYEVTPLSGKFSVKLSAQAAQDIAAPFLKIMNPRGEVPPSSGTAALGKDQTVAVFGFTACPSNGKLEYSAGLLADMLANDLQQSASMQLVEREKLEHILAEKKLQLAGVTVRDQAMLASKLLGADYLLTGSLIRAGKTLRIDAQLLNVATGAVVASASEKTTDDKLMETHEKLAEALSKRIGPGLTRLSRLKKSPRAWRTAEAQIQADWAETLVKMDTEREEPFINQVDSLIRVAQDLAPENGEVNTSAGMVAAYLGRNDVAERLLQKGVERAPNNHVCNLHYARFLTLRRKEPKTALKHIKKGLDFFLAGRDIPVDKLYRTVPPNFIRTMIYCSLNVGDIKEAHRWGEALVHSGDATGETNDAVVAVAVAENSCDKTAAMLLVGGSKNLTLIKRLYKLSGKTEEQKKFLLMSIRNSYLKTDERLKLAILSKKSHLELAAAICRRIILHHGCKKDLPIWPDEPHDGFTNENLYPGYWSFHPRVSDVQAKNARRILEELKQPLEQPLITGPVFDIEALRKRGIKYALVKYDKFPYEEQLPYIVAYLEDVFGIPIAVNKGFRSLPEGPFDSLRGVVIQDNLMEKDLARGRNEVGGVAVTGLMGHPLSQINRQKLDLIFYTTDRSMVSTTLCAGVTPPTHAAKTSIIGNMLRNLSFCVGTRVMPRKILKEVQPCCLTQTCAMAYYVTREREMVPCPVCRRELYENLKDWPRGKPERDSIVAGPAEPALADGVRTAEVLLVPMDVSAEYARLEKVSRCIAASLGLRCKIHDSIERNDNIPAAPKSLAEISPKLKDLDKQYAAICIITGGRFSEKPWNDMLIGEAEVTSKRHWRVWIPELEEPGPKTACPLIVLSVAPRGDFSLPFCYRRMETFNVMKDGQTIAVQAPAYSKALIGALAIAARKDHECWTLGCPTTVWETTGVPHRCSHYLCPECRKAVAEYYAPPKK